MRKKTFTLFILLCLITACGGGKKQASAPDSGTPIPLRHADNLTLTEYDDYTLAHLRNPWDTAKVLHTYILIDKDNPLPAHLPEGTVVRTPLQKSVIYTAVHGSLLKELGAWESIAGVSDLKYVMLNEVHEAVRRGTIADIGNSMNPDIEKIIDLHPDALLLSPYENSGGYGRVEKLNVPLIECAEYMETTALGRAEWMRFYGRLFGCEETADSLFAEVEHSYLTLKALTQEIKPRPTAFCDLKTGSTWYLPGGQSFIARLYADAGADYILADDTHSGSLPFSFEAVFDKAADADFWLIKYNQPADKTYRELESDYASYAGFRAFKERRIYGCNTGRVAYYEETPFHPDRILRDLIKIFHPSLLKEQDTEYFTTLAE